MATIDTPLTCGHCRNSPATHILVVFYAPPLPLERRTEIVCQKCGEFSAGLTASFCHTVQIYRVEFVHANQEA